MANALYAYGKEQLLSAGINFSSDTMKLALVSSSYTPNTSSHQFWSSVSANLVGTAQTLGSKTVTGGVADCADVTYTAVAGGSTVAYLVLYKDTGVAGTSPLLAIWDTVTGFPLSTSGSDINIVIDNGSNRLFRL